MTKWAGSILSGDGLETPCRAGTGVRGPSGLGTARHRVQVLPEAGDQDTALPLLIKKITILGRNKNLCRRIGIPC